ncbi:portal protein [Candidatus Avelusimicrobium alvi]|uniref:portal protein n=1 Tax=Candidatus Avelusimicrobium alvi TaxID=3416221 RepID=UPI003D1005FB
MKNNNQPTTDYLRLYGELKSERASWLPVWKDLCAYLAPTRGFFDGQTPNQGRRIDHKTLLDSDPCLAVEVLCAGMMSGLTSPSRSWFDLALAPEELMELPGAREWVLEVKKHLEDVFAKSNVYSVLHGFYQEIAVFGTAAFLLEEDPEKGLRCRPFTIGEYVLGTDASGRVNRFGREFFMTAAQMQETFGAAALPPAVKRECDENRQARWHKIIHLILPNRSADPDKADNKHMPYRSVYLTEDGKILRESGYREFPVIAARWEVKNASDSYGRGPGWKCLGDVKMLQKMQKTKLVALDKSTNPPMMVSSNVQGEVNLLPGGITRYNGTTDAAVKPAYQVQPDLKSLEASIQSVRATIRSQFFADVFLMLTAQNYSNMTAAEVAERHQEKMLVLGPVLERLKNELLDPLIDRAFNLLSRQGLLPAAPQSIQGLEMKVEYVSMIAQAQKAAGLASLVQGLNYAASLAAARPEVLDRVDYDRALEEGLNTLGVAPALLRSAEDAQALRRSRLEAALAAGARPSSNNARADARPGGAPASGVKTPGALSEK